MEVTDDLLEMARNSYGYGRWDARFWFIGPEQGMSKDEDELTSRVVAWRIRGSRELDDCREYHCHIQEHRWHGYGSKPPVLQKTWAKLLLTLLAYEGLPCDLDSRRSYQASRWGSLLGDTCVIEVSGVPAHSEAVKRDRESFFEMRIDTIRRKMELYKPEFVLLYGKSVGCTKAWNAMTQGGEVFQSQTSSVCAISRYRKTILAWSPHPVSYSLKSEHWEKLGLTLKQLNYATQQDS